MAIQTLDDEKKDSAFWSPCLLVVPLPAGCPNARAGQRGSSISFRVYVSAARPASLLKLETDWGQLVKEKLGEEYQPGVLSFPGPDGTIVELEISARARGNTRKEVCQFPPLKIKPAKKQLHELGLDPSSKLKLVLPCQNGKSNSEYLLKEALAYQLFAAIYPIHHRTKLVELEGWQNNKEKYSFYAFLVEEEKEFAARVNGKRVKQEKINTIDLERDSYVKMCFFQYMIANTDWSAPNGHNLELLKLPGKEKMVPIPYDFDYAGFVDTDYAIPRSSVPIENVTQRFFLGKYVTEEEALECARFYLSKKEQLLQICRSFDLLRDKSQDQIQEFLSGFFDTLADEEAVRQTFVTMRRRPNQD